VVVVRHLAVGEDEPAEPLRRLEEQSTEDAMIAVDERPRLPVVATGDDVVDGTAEVGAMWSSHATRLAGRGRTWASRRVRPAVRTAVSFRAVPRKSHQV
jgi:hypothetical protein